MGLAGAVSDQLYFTSMSGERTVLLSRPVGMLEPLLEGLLGMEGRMERAELERLVKGVVGRFDSVRGSPGLLSSLVEGGLGRWPTRFQEIIVVSGGWMCLFHWRFVWGIGRGG